MRIPAQADLQRWSDVVARDPRSLAFLPLARAYRKQGLADAAMQLCLRGLESYPSHVEAHALLAVLFAERGDRQKAADEWSIVLRLDRDNFEALRGLGFCFLEEDRLSRARQMLERAALLRPEDPAVSEALRLLGTRQELIEPRAGSRSPVGSGHIQDPGPPTLRAAPAQDSATSPAEHDLEPWTAYAAAPESSASPASPSASEPTPPAAEPWEPREPPAEAPQETSDSPAQQREADTRQYVAEPRYAADAATATETADHRAPASSAVADPAELFAELLGTGPVLAVLLVDARGLVLAGRITDGAEDDAAMLGAVLGGAAGEAARTVAHLSLGEWRGVLMETASALLHLTPVGDEAVIVLAARHSTPAGWMRRAAAQAVERAQPFLEAYR